jgi:hypothetical protein
MIVEARKAGLRMTEIPMTVEERRHGNSKVVSSIIQYVLAQSYIIVSTLLRKK